MTLPVCSDPARARTQEVYAAIESTAHTAETLTDADYIEVTEDPSSLKATRATINNLSRTAGLDPLPIQKGQTEIQEFTFKTYIYHASAAGSIPHLAQLWEAMMGTETINGGSDVVYSASDADTALPNMTFLVKSDNESQSFSAQITSGVPDISPTNGDESLLQIVWTARISKWYSIKAGKASGTGSTGPDVVTFTDKGEAARFAVGAIVYDGTTVLNVTAVDLSAGTITLDATPVIGAVNITPWSPGAPASSPWTEFQYLASDVNVVIGTVTSEDSNELPILTGSMLYDNDVTVRNNETGRPIGSMCANRTKTRTITFSLGLVRYSKTAEWVTAAYDNRDTTISVIATAADGSTRTFEIEQGTDGVAKIAAGDGGTDNDMLSDNYVISFADSEGGNTAVQFKFA